MAFHLDLQSSQTKVAPCMYLFSVCAPYHLEMMLYYEFIHNVLLGGDGSNAILSHILLIKHIK